MLGPPAPERNPNVMELSQEFSAVSDTWTVDPEMWTVRAESGGAPDS